MIFQFFFCFANEGERRIRKPFETVLELSNFGAKNAPLETVHSELFSFLKWKISLLGISFGS